MLGGPVKIGSAPALSSPLGFFAGRRPKQLRQHLGAPRPTAGMGRAVGLCGGDRCVGGLFLAPVDLARVILQSPASPGPNGLFYSIGGSPAVTLDPNGLFYAGSRGLASLSAGAYLEGPPVGFNVVVLMQGQPMLGAGARLRRSQQNPPIPCTLVPFWPLLPHRGLLHGDPGP